MILEYCPRSQILDWLGNGFRLVPGHDYQPGDYAILMFKPEVATKLPDAMMQAIAKRFANCHDVRSNKSRGSSSRMWQQRARKIAEVAG